MSRIGGRRWNAQSRRSKYDSVGPGYHLAPLALRMIAVVVIVEVMAIVIMVALVTP
jgi:hypothetical protein